MNRLPLRSLSRPLVSLPALCVCALACSSPPEGAAAMEIPAFGNDFGGAGDGSSGAVGQSGGGGETAVSGSEPQAVCSPGATRCGNGGALETCNSRGSGFDVAACEGNSVCVAGSCQPFSCEAGQLLCLGAEVHSCNDDGETSSLVSSCGAGEACDPATFGCRQLQQPVTPIDPGDSPLDPPTEVTLACTPGEVWCDGNSLNTCNGAGSGSTVQPCGEGTCDAAASACLDPQICTPLATSCDGPSAFGTCSADGRSFDAQRCPDGTNCQGGGNCTPISCNPQGLTSFNGGEATVYWFGQGTVNFGDIACGYGINPGNLGNGAGDAVNGIADRELFAAMNTANYRGSAACGACVEMNYQGRNVTVTVVDECPIGSNPTCTAGHVDLSRGAWNALTGGIPGTQIFGVNWRFVPCPTNGNVTIELKEPNNQYWNEFLVRNHRYPIERAEVQRADGTWVQAQRTPYNYFHPPNDDMGTYRVRVTDINGGVIEEQLALSAGGQGGNSQFACQ